MEDFDLRKYLAEGKLYEAINLDIQDNIATLSGDSGEYEGEIDEFAIFHAALSATQIKSLATKSLATVLSGDTSVDTVGKVAVVWGSIRGRN